jgi:hypothetical protein
MLKKIKHLEDTGIDGKTKLKKTLNKKKIFEGVDLIYKARVMS